MYLGEVEGLGEGYWVSEEEGLEEVNGMPCSCWTRRGTSRRGRPVYGLGTGRVLGTSLHTDGVHG